VTRRLTFMIVVLALLAACRAMPPASPPAMTVSPLISAAVTTPAASPTAIAPIPSATTPHTIAVSILFLDKKKFEVGTPPFESPAVRTASQGEDLPTFIVSEYFKGPTAAEQAQGLELVTSGFTGFKRVEVKDGVAHVYLLGECKSGGSVYTIAQPLMASLLRLEGIRAVKIYDAQGQTEHPEGQQNSIPFCLEP